MIHAVDQLFRACAGCAVVSELASVAVRSAWQSTVIAVFLWVLLRSLPALSPKTSFRICAVAFVAATALPLCPCPIALSQLGQIGQTLPSASIAAALNSSSLAPVASIPPVWAAVLCAVWLAASSVAIVRLGAGVFSLRRLLRTAQPASPALQAIFRNANPARASKRVSEARLLVSDRIAAPSACGLFGAAIVLPRSLVATLPPEEMAGVLRHEAAHLRRWDDWLAVLSRLVRAALPLALGVPYLERQMARAREMACDDAALCPGSSRRSYAASLARVAETARSEQWRRLAPGLGGDSSQLAARVNHILRPETPVRGPGPLRIAAAGCAGTLLSLLLLTSPAFLSFTQPAALARVVDPRVGTRAVAPGPPYRPGTSTVRLVRSRLSVAHPRRGATSVARTEHEHLLTTSPLHGADLPVPQAILVRWSDDGREQPLILLAPLAQPDWSNLFLLTI